MVGKEGIKASPRPITAGGVVGSGKPLRTRLRENRLLMEAVAWFNRVVPWYRLPTLPAVFSLAAYREVLRARNLHDTTLIPARGAPSPEQPAPPLLQYRTADGSYNDLAVPTMGQSGTRFGRNIPLGYAYPDTGPALMSPSPREISRRLLARESFKPATTLNLLAAGWIQFQIHDWFNHGQPQAGGELEVPLQGDDDWFENPMRIRRTPADATRLAGADDGPPTFINPTSHWWDASGVYGSDEAAARRLRAGCDGLLKVRDGKLPLDPQSGISLTGFSDNWWLGLGLLHTLFALEHNAICERLKLEYPSWTDDQLFHTARLINSALMAKIHTVEWTPAILANPTLRIGMRSNWWGLAEEQLSRLVGRITTSDLISGIPGSEMDHHGAPYQLTEEFTAVYRLHPLIPDEVAFSSLNRPGVARTMSFLDIAAEKAEHVIGAELSTQDVLYSFGINHPGAVQLHNFPQSLRDLTIKIPGPAGQPPDERRLDSAATDVMRDRERGVPRYNDFRRRLHLRPVASFEDLAANPQWARELAEVYDGDVERVDAMVGMYAEAPPPGFGFSDTAFRIFILMASRRLKSDRFFTTDYRPNVYTSIGMRWIENNGMVSVLLGHYPELAPALRGVANPFAPWRSIWPWRNNL